MAHRDPNRIESDGFSWFVSIVGSLSRYDALLLVIPMAFVAALGLGTLVEAPPEMTVVAASAVGAIAIFDGLFRNPPTAGSGPR